jgi:hypothetical protein
MASAIPTNTFSESGVQQTYLQKILLQIIANGRRPGNPRLPPELWDFIWTEFLLEDTLPIREGSIRRLMVKFEDPEHPELKMIACKVHFSFSVEMITERGYKILERFSYPCATVLEFSLDNNTFRINSMGYRIFHLDVSGNSIVSRESANIDNTTSGGVVYYDESPAIPVICRHDDYQLENFQHDPNAFYELAYNIDIEEVD